MSQMQPNAEADIATINSIEAVPSILEVVCHATGMGFAAVARVTEGRWIACSVLDRIDFGLQPGGELKVETTICHAIRQTGEGGGFVIERNVDAPLKPVLTQVVELKAGDPDRQIDVQERYQAEDHGEEREGEQHVGWVLRYPSSRLPKGDGFCKSSTHPTPMGC